MPMRYSRISTAEVPAFLQSKLKAAFRPAAGLTVASIDPPAAKVTEMTVAMAICTIFWFKEFPPGTSSLELIVGGPSSPT